MPNFAYEAYDQGGQRLRGVLAGTTLSAVLAELESRKLQPIDVREQGEQRSGLRLGGGLPVRQLGQAYGQLGELLHAGVPLMRAIALIARAKARPGLARAFKQIGEHVGEGGEISAAMEQRPELFPRTHVAMIRAGERGGFLEQVFQRLGEYVEKQADLNAKLVGNMIYPAVLVTVGTIILVVIFVVFIPMLEPVLAQQREREGLPAITEVLFAISNNALPAASVVAGVLVGLFAASRHARVGRAMNIGMTRAPVVGGLVRTLATIRFCRMLGTMEANGVPLLQAMGIAKEAAGNVLLEGAIDRAIEAVRGGDQLATPLAESGLFDEDVVEMIRVGEAAGTVDTVLLNIARTLESRIDRLLTAVTKLVEPLLLAVIAGVVLFVASGILLPLMNMTRGLGGS